MKRLLLILPFALAACDGSVTDPARPVRAPTELSSVRGHSSGVFTDFEDFALGSVNGQHGWTSTGPYDQEVVENTYGYRSFQAQSWRISNAVTSGSFGDHTFSERTPTSAGEEESAGGGFDLGGGVRENHFDASWTFASTVPGAEQPGLSVVASPDRGDGARMSWVQMADGPGGLAVNFYEVRGRSNPANFVEHFLVKRLNRARPHTIAISMTFREGPSNDVVKVYVDGVLEHTGTSWENYFRFDSEAAGSGNQVPIVNRILFRTGGEPAPETSGNGFVIDNLTVDAYSRDRRHHHGHGHGDDGRGGAHGE